MAVTGSNYSIKDECWYLGHLFFGYAYMFALGLVITKTVKNGGSMANDKLNRHKLSKKAVHNALEALPDSDVDVFFLWASNLFEKSTADNLIELYSSVRGYNNRKPKREMLDDDNTFIQSIAANVTDWPPKTMSLIWNQEQKKDKDCKVAAVLKVALEPKVIVQATSDVQIALNKDSQAKHEATVNIAWEAIRQETRRDFLFLSGEHTYKIWHLTCNTKTKNQLTFS